jgi:hypothetical protein
MKNYIKNKKKDFDMLQRGVVLGLVAGVAGNFFVTSLYKLIESGSLYEKYSTLINWIIFIVSILFIVFMYRFFESGLKNFEKRNIMKQKDFENLVTNEAIGLDKVENKINSIKNKFKKKND